MYKRILIANRGEIAVRVIRTCREMGIETVAVHSEADADCLHVQLADHKVCVGPAATRDSYLNASNIISAALITQSQAIHPGVGFLAERPHFAQACKDCDIGFIGPSPDAMEKMGNKALARRLVSKQGVPVVPGTDGVVEAEQQAAKFATQVGYPVMIKAAAGGGGRGVRVVHNEAALGDALRMAQMEAKSAFGDDTVYLEKYLDEPRHIEFQVMGDSHGNIIHLGERECSLQKNHQKVLEEAPCDFISSGVRRRMGEAAVRAARAVGYQNAGTVEFLVDKDENFYFIEMNTRLQVEHPVTEAVVGLDLVAEQIRVATGERLSLSQKQVNARGAAIECRIDARDMNNNYSPVGGKITAFLPAGGPGVRVDTHLYPGYTVPTFYDPLLAKVIVHAQNREQAIARMGRALGETVLEGVPTNLPLHQAVLENAFFRRGQISTNFMRRRLGL